MTNRFNKLLTIAVVLSLLTPTSGGLLAQDGDETSAATATTNEANTVSATNWYQSERISGNIEVGDFVVGPGRTEISAAPGETVVQEITVTNRISDNRSFQLEVEDITGSADGSSAVSLVRDGDGPYSIRDYITFPEDTFELELGERARIPVTIEIPADAEPGGYYGSVLVSTVRQSNENGTQGSRAPIIARVGSLFFLTIEGDIEREGETTAISTLNDKWWYESGPVEFNILHENSGTVHVNPYGEISVTNIFGEEVGFVELEPWFVLPKSLRSREVTWDREFLLGRYTATAKINRGYDDVVDEVSVSFWVVPWKFVAGTFVVLFVLVFVIRLFFKTFEFKRK